MKNEFDTELRKRPVGAFSDCTIEEFARNVLMVDKITLSDYTVKPYLESWKADSQSIKPLMYTVRNNVITVYTAQPGWYIGAGGSLFDGYENLFKKIFGNEVELNIIEANII